MSQVERFVKKWGTNYLPSQGVGALSEQSLPVESVLPMETAEMYDQRGLEGVSNDVVSDWVQDQYMKRGRDLDLNLEGSDQRAWDFLNRFEDHVLFEDDDLLVVNKPIHVLSHHHRRRVPQHSRDRRERRRPRR